MKKNLLFYGLLALTASLVVACGGGGSGNAVIEQLKKADSYDLSAMASNSSLSIPSFNMSQSNTSSGIAVSSNLYSGFLGGSNNTRIYRHTDGSVYTWGDNTYGTMGNGFFSNSGDISLTPNKITLPYGMGAVVRVSLGQHALALDDNGALYVWGRNDKGQLGLGDTSHRNTPTYLDKSSYGGSAIAQIARGFHHSLLLTTQGTLYGWGDNSFGQLALDPSQNGNVYKTTPTKINTTFGDDPIVAIGTTSYGSYALTGSGKLFTWGDIACDGAIHSGFSSFDETHFGNQKLVAATAHSCSVFAKNSNWDVYAWGSNNNGELGVGDNSVHNTPTKINMGAVRVVRLVAGNFGGFLYGDDGQLYGWGKNDKSQLGIGGGDRYSPISLRTIDDTYSFGTHLDGGFISRSTDFVMWGDNSYAKYGNGTTLPFSTPTTVAWNTPAALPQAVVTTLATMVTENYNSATFSSYLNFYIPSSANADFNRIVVSGDNGFSSENMGGINIGNNNVFLLTEFEASVLSAGTGYLVQFYNNTTFVGSQRIVLAKEAVLPSALTASMFPAIVNSYRFLCPSNGVFTTAAWYTLPAGLSLVSEDYNSCDTPGYFFGKVSAKNSYGQVFTSTLNKSRVVNGSTTAPILPSSVLSPNGGETLSKGNVFTVTWNNSDFGSSHVDIYLLGHSSTTTFSAATHQELSDLVSADDWYPVARVINNGSSFITMPSSIPSGPFYYLLIVGSDNKTEYDTSDSSFAISPVGN